MLILAPRQYRDLDAARPSLHGIANDSAFVRLACSGFSPDADVKCKDPEGHHD
jgi:hypothetical protein